MKNMISIFLFLLLSGAIVGQTHVSGGLYSNTNWTVANSPYIVTGKLIVFPDYTLTIEPGVIVKFDSGSSLECRGRLSAIGTASDSITFTSNSDSPFEGSWQGIIVIGLDFSAPSGQVKMEYCKGMYANCFIDLDLAYQGPYIFNHCYFYKNSKVNYDGGTGGTFFNYCRFQSNTSALNYVQFGGRVSHSEFFDNGDGVNGFENVDSCVFHNNINIALSPYGSATGNIVYDNNIGVQCYFNAKNNTFIRNQVYNNNIGVDILSYFNGSINFRKNFICNNTLFNIRNSGINDANIGYNCYCSIDSIEVRAGIYDGYTDSSVGLVSFMPLLSSCDSFVEPGDSIPTFDSVPIFDSTNRVDQGIKIYPNPVLSNGTINILLNKNVTNGVLSIFNLMGTKVYSQKFVGAEKRITCNLPQGIYLLQIVEGKQSWLKKFYKE
jgi:hypothetical protein